MNATLHLLAVVLISVVAGAMNAIAGGGTLLTFPALIGLGIPPLVANATSTVALWPGSARSIWGYRESLPGRDDGPSASRCRVFSAASSARCCSLATDERLLRTRPLAGTWRDRAVHGAGPPLNAWLKRPSGDGRSERDGTDEFPSRGCSVFQFLVGIYGGYFGAGAGILMLAALGLMGLTNIHRMNGLKNWGGLCMNAVAAIMFAFSGLVNWPVALSMAVGAIGGGYLGSRMAQRVGQQTVRIVIVVMGLAAESGSS